MTDSPLYNNLNISACIITDGADLDKLFKAVRSCFSSCSEIVICANGKYEEVKFTFRHYSKVKVFPQVWEKDFSKARNEAIEKCKGDWIFVIDSDEELQTPIEYLSDDFDIYLVQMHTDIEGNTASCLKLRSPRIFKNNDAIRFKGMIHENVNYENMKLCHSDILVKQFEVKDKELFIKKIERNIEILIKDVDNPYRDYLICQSFQFLNEDEKVLFHGEKVIHSELYANQNKALVCVYMANALLSLYDTKDAAIQMLLLSITFEPRQIFARKMLVDLLEKQNAPKHIIDQQYKTLEDINKSKSSQLPLEVYYNESFFATKIN